MTKSIRKVWTFGSDSNPGAHYETLQYIDRTTSCGCKGWTRRVASDGSRSCKYTRWVDQGIADRHCVASHDYNNHQNSTQSHVEQQTKPLQGSDNASSLSEHGTKIIHYLQAGYPGLYLVSPEEQRVEAELKSVLQHLNRNRKQGEQYQLCYWSVIDGLVNTNTQQIHSANDPLEVLQLRWSASGNPPVGGCVF
jgi:hypothetical protein